METVRRRIDNHMEWWQSSLLVQEDEDGGAELTERNKTGHLEP